MAALVEKFAQRIGDGATELTPLEPDDDIFDRTEMVRRVQPCHSVPLPRLRAHRAPAIGHGIAGHTPPGKRRSGYSRIR